MPDPGPCAAAGDGRLSESAFALCARDMDGGKSNPPPSPRPSPFPIPAIPADKGGSRCASSEYAVWCAPGLRPGSLPADELPALEGGRTGKGSEGPDRLAVAETGGKWKSCGKDGFPRCRTGEEVEGVEVAALLWLRFRPKIGRRVGESLVEGAGSSAATAREEAEADASTDMANPPCKPAGGIDIFGTPRDVRTSRYPGEGRIVLPPP